MAVDLPVASQGKGAILAVPLASDFKVRLSFVYKVFPSAIDKYPVRESTSASVNSLFTTRFFNLLPVNNPLATV